MDLPEKLLALAEQAETHKAELSEASADLEDAKQNQAAAEARVSESTSTKDAKTAQLRATHESFRQLVDELYLPTS